MNYFWGGIVVSVIISYFVQDRENKLLEKRIEDLER